MYLPKFCNIIAYSFILFIVVTPEITTHPQNGTKTEGENVTLFCNISANPLPKLSWTIDGSPVNTMANPRISLSLDKQELTITNVSRVVSGEYRCVANNIVGNAISNVVKLDVQCNFTVLTISDAHQEYSLP